MFSGGSKGNTREKYVNKAKVFDGEHITENCILNHNKILEFGVVLEI